MRHFADPVACVRRQVFGDQTESNRMFRRPLCCAEVFAMLSIAKTLFGSLLVAGCLSCAAQAQGLSEPTLDAAHAAEIDARVLSIGHPRDEAIASFTERLVAGLETPRERLYAIYRWVARYIDYDVESYLSGRLMGAGGADNTFRSGRSVCNGYADLLVEMGKVAGLRIEKVEGHAKGFGPGLTTASLQDKENHAWNAVELDGRWYLLDVTWDSGGVDAATRAFVKRSGEPIYFLAQPDLFVTTHYPSAAQWQLLPQPLSFEHFLGRTKLRPDLRRWGVDPSAHVDEHIVSADDMYAFDFGASALRLQATLMQGSQVVSGNWSFQIRTPEGGSRLLLAAPTPSEYRATIFSSPDPQATQLEPVLDYTVQFAHAGRFPYGFPQAYSGYYAQKVELASPLDGRLRAGEPVRFKLRLPDAEKVTVFQGNNIISELTPVDGYYTAEVCLPEGQVDVAVILKGGTQYAGILSYQVAGAGR